MHPFPRITFDPAVMGGKPCNPSKGILIWGAYPYRYLTVQISYQTTPDIPYAERARFEDKMR